MLHHSYLVARSKLCNFSHSNFSEEFHKFEVDWDQNAITFYVDGEQTLKVDPGDQGFWEFGNFEAQAPGIDNPWKGTANKLTPFDQEVIE